MNNGFLLV